MGESERCVSPGDLVLPATRVDKTARGFRGVRSHAIIIQGEENEESDLSLLSAFTSQSMRIASEDSKVIPSVTFGVGFPAQSVAFLSTHVTPRLFVNARTRRQCEARS